MCLCVCVCVCVWLCMCERENVVENKYSGHHKCFCTVYDALFTSSILSLRFCHPRSCLFFTIKKKLTDVRIVLFFMYMAFYETILNPLEFVSYCKSLHYYNKSPFVGFTDESVHYDGSGFFFFSSFVNRS